MIKRGFDVISVENNSLKLNIPLCHPMTAQVKPLDCIPFPTFCIWLYVIALSFNLVDLFIVWSVSFVIGQSDNFGFGCITQMKTALKADSEVI